MVEKGFTPAFLSGGGEMGKRMRSKDWSGSVLGTPEQWPQGLRTTVNIILNSKFPMFVWWGKELTTFYNDPYCPIAGEKHPDLLGKSGREAWSEIWDDLSPLVENVFNGISTWSEDQVLYINRHGYTEETYFTFSYSPILEENGTVAGLFCACIETTEKVLAERKIRESERNLRNTILQAPVAMCILKGPSFVVEIANTRMFELWGRGANELINKPIFEGLPEAGQQGLEELLIQVYQTGKPFFADERPIQLPRHGGIEKIIVNFVYQPFRDGDGQVSGIIVVAIDATQQVEARRKVEESEHDLQVRVQQRTEELVKQSHLVDNILKNSSNGISVTEMIRNEEGAVIDARTILANDAAIRNTGLSREIYLSKTAIELDADILNSAYGKSCLETLVTGQPFVIQYFLEFTGRWLELSVSKMDDDHLIHIFTDVTSTKEAQLQLERTVEELRRSNNNLEQFAYAASHDLKEPVRKINIFSDRLKKELKESLTEHQQTLFERMHTATERMSILIDDLLEYSHATNGLSTVEKIDLNSLVQLVLEDLEMQILEKGANISMGTLPSFLGNKRQIQQLFQNLISNSLKYSRSGISPTISLTAAVVKGRDTSAKLSGEECNKWYHLIEVRDNGIGFEKKFAEDIFNVFTRLHSTTEYTGSGVGLSIARRVIVNHGGYIWADSTPGEGSVFSFLLPVSPNETLENQQ